MHAVTRLAAQMIAVLCAVACLSCTTAPKHAAAQPPGFPDLSGFAPVPVENYTDPPGSKGLRYARFSTPFNIACWFAAADPVPVWHSQDINCLGDMPDANPCMVAKASPGSGPAYVINKTGDTCGAPHTNGVPLNVGQKVSYRDATCAVGADHLVACLDTSHGEHGFVLKPSGSFAF